MSKYNWSLKYPDRARETQGRRRRRVRLEILEAYGKSRCALCSCSDTRVLDLDHIDGGGTRHRRHLKGKIYDQLYIEGFPDKGKYRILCRNCNWIVYLEKLKANKKPVTYSDKNYWPFSVVARAVALVNDGRKQGGIGAKKAFSIAVEDYNRTADIKFVLPEACKNNHASGILRGMKKRVEKQVEICK